MKMKVFAAILLAPLLVAAAILPESIGSYRRAAVSQPVLTDRQVWSEYGLQGSESCIYEVNGKQHFSAAVWQFQDTTGAFGAFEWQRPSAAVASDLAPLAAETKTALLLIHGNYLLRFEGYKPSKPELAAITESLKNVDTTSLPALSGYLPSGGLVPNSERYITGPAALARFEPAIPPSVASFHVGAEAQLGVFQGPKGKVTVSVFNYPSAQIAMQKLPGFATLPGVLAKRSGPLIAIVLSPADPDFAERLLGQRTLPGIRDPRRIRSHAP